jgi:hypothetical protein
MGLHFAGPLDVAALERSIDVLVERHETLRLIFQNGPNGCRMIVTDGRAISMRQQSVENEAPGQRMARALGLIAEEAQRPFDLASGPLVRAMLVRLSDTEHLLGLVVDKILVERNSCVILQRDLLASYNQALGLTEADLPDLTLQFADYAAWQRSYLQGEASEQLLGYWRTALNGVDAFPNVGMIDPESRPGRPRGLAIHTTTVPAELLVGLEKAARSEGASLYAALVSALKAVIYARRRLALGQGATADVSILGSVANRGYRAMKDVVGYLASYTVLRTDLSGNPTLATLMERETGAIFGAVCHQEVPHSLITRTISPHQYGALHRFGRNDVPHFLHFDTDDDWTSMLSQPTTLRVRAVRVPLAEVPHGWLRLIARNVPEGMMLQLRYRTDFFSAGWAESFLDHYVDVLRLWPERLGHRLSDLG